MRITYSSHLRFADFNGSSESIADLKPKDSGFESQDKAMLDMLVIAVVLNGTNTH
jgi:hypothetical protein